VLLVVILAVLGVALVGAVAGAFFYARATEPDRSTPTVVVQQFLTAIFVEQDQTRAGLFVCASLSPTDAMAKANELVDRDAKASWDTVVTTTEAGNTAEVQVRMRLRYPGDLAPSGERQWRFHLSNQQGWRVCGFEAAD
jgi:hypothetical protein